MGVPAASGGHDKRPAGRFLLESFMPAVAGMTENG